MTVRSGHGGRPPTEILSIFTAPVDAAEFSVLVSIALAVLVVGVAALVVGCVLMMPKVGAHWWQGLIPGYNFYRLFRGARCEVLFAAYIVDAAFVFGFFFADDPVTQGLIWWPVFLGVLMFQWLALCLAQRMHLNWFWQVLSFLVPSFAFCLIGLMPVEVDPDWYPWAVRPFIRFEHAVWTHDWEYDPQNPASQLDPEDEASEGEDLAEDYEDEGILEDEEPPEEYEDGEYEDGGDPADEGVPGADWEQGDMGNSEGEIPSEGTIMSDYESEEGTQAEPEAEKSETEEPGSEVGAVPAEERFEGEPVYRGHGFDPEGDEAVEEADGHEPASFTRHVDHILDEEARLFDRRPGAAERRGRPDDDLSDLVEGQIEGLYAEQLGYPGVTQDVDAEEAAYLEENATYARERILEETHDEPDGNGYVGRHLADAVRKVEREEATDPDWPEPERTSEPEPKAKPKATSKTKGKGRRKPVNDSLNGRLPNID